MALLANRIMAPPLCSNGFVDRASATACWVANLDTQLGEYQCQAGPHSIVEGGAVKGLYEDVRGETAAQIFRLSLSNGDISELGCSLRVLCAVFQTEHAFISVITGDTINVTHACGPALQPCTPPHRQGFCGWAFLPSSNEIFCVEDLTKDQRYSLSPFVAGAGTWRSYLAAPLIASNNQRIGTLCIAGVKPMNYNATAASILSNMAELTVRALEGVWARQVMREETENLGDRLMRSIECYERCFLFVDSAEGNWNVLHLNHAAADVLGLGIEERSFPLQSLFRIPAVSSGWGTACAGMIGPRQLFTLSNIVTHPNHLPGIYDLVFRPASCEAIDADACPVGMPNYVEDGPETAPHYFFVEMRVSEPPQQSSRNSSLDSDVKVRVVVPGVSGLSCPSSSDVTHPSCSPTDSDSAAPGEMATSGSIFTRSCPFEGLVMGRLLGTDDVGWVYRATYNGTLVAVKIVPLLSAAEEGPIQESLKATVQHPNIVQRIEHRITSWTQGPHPRAIGQDANATTVGPSHTAWIIYDYCNRGTLLEAVEKGWFREAAICTAKTNMLLVVRIARQIADALHAHHSQGIVHGELCSGRVLLQSSNSMDGAGIIAKLGTAGISRALGSRFVTVKKRDQSVTHTAPELLSGLSYPTQASDVYALGVICWELVSHIRAWANMLHTQVLVSVVMRREQLVFAADVEPVFAELARRCMSFTPEARPSLDTVLTTLRMMEQQYSSFSRGEASMVQAMEE